MINLEYGEFNSLSWLPVGTIILCTQGFPDDSSGKESACNAGDTGDTADVGLITEWGRPFGGGNGNPL